VKFVIVLLFISIGLFNFAFSKEKIQLNPNEVKIRVKGVVCSFCAYGTEKNLANLNFLDKSQYGDNGVLVDISTQLITVSVDKNKKANLGEIYDAITKGGYDAVTIYIYVEGKVQKKADKLIITSNEGQIFELPKDDLKNLNLDEQVKLILFFPADQITSLKQGSPIVAKVDSVQGA